MKKRDGVIPGTLKDVLADIGRLAFIQLSRLRHRGALTTVSQTFLTCCQFSPRLENNSGGDSLLKTWYQVCQGSSKVYRAGLTLTREELAAS